MTTHLMKHDTRLVGWIKAARKAFESFPAAVRDRVNTALTIAAEGGKADIAKPLKASGRASWRSPSATGPMPSGWSA